jgi:hypothetical protein
MKDLDLPDMRPCPGDQHLVEEVDPLRHLLDRLIQEDHPPPAPPRSRLERSARASSPATLVDTVRPDESP